jgi:hypothetical protein
MSSQSQIDIFNTWQKEITLAKSPVRYGSSAVLFVVSTATLIWYILNQKRRLGEKGTLLTTMNLILFAMYFGEFLVFVYEAILAIADLHPLDTTLVV